MLYTWKKWKRFYEDMYQEYTHKWETWDEVMYDVCHKYYSHAEMNGIAAELGVVGKSDRSGFIGSSEKDLSHVVDFFHQKREPFDKIFKRLKPLTGPLDADKLDKIAGIEGEFASILSELKKHPDTTRSFASKYLHFHCRSVPIYDVRNEEVLLNEEWYPAPARPAIPLPKHAEERYYRYGQRFLCLYNDLKKIIPGLGVKVVDYYLLEEYYRFKRHQE